MTGTEKQIAWAEQIKDGFLHHINKCYCTVSDTVEADEANNMSICRDIFCENHDSAAWWIEHRAAASRMESASDLFVGWIDENFEAFQNEYFARGGIIVE